MLPILLQVEHLNLTTSRGSIVTNIFFDIKRGEIVALTGKSGSGKSSIALAILGLLPPDIKSSGHIFYTKRDGEKIAYPTDHHKWTDLPGREIGFIQQDMYGAFDPVMRMGKQMMMIIRERTLKDSTTIESELKDRLKEVGLSETKRIWNSFPHQLSGGQLQRCQLALVICLQPSLLIADEPTSAIDKLTQVEILDLLHYIRITYGISILCITHDESVVNYLCDREIALPDNIQTEVIIPKQPTASSPGNAVLFEIDGLGYQHRFGGIIEQSGARVQSIKFSLRQKECIGIIGESGSGKSTLANMLVGSIIPSEGSMFLEGEKIDFRLPGHLRMLRARVQLVMQDGRGSLHPGMKIRRLLEEVVDNQIRSGENKPQDITSSLAEVGLSPDILDRFPSTLSGGECLRVNIARSLLVEPAIIILDESTSSLDHSTRNGILDLLMKLMDYRNLAVILISHDIEVVASLANYILVFEDGQIIESGTVEELLASAQHESTKKFFATQATILRKKGR